METAAVYRRFDESKLADLATIGSEDFAQWTTLDAMSLLPRLRNDLEPAAFAIDSELGKLRAEAEQVLRRPVRMSGSGSSLFTLFDDGIDAKAAAEVLARELKVAATVVELAPRMTDEINEFCGTQ
jgi:4-diphosphocytidyl-2C-methyl-D-erythritol kinase